MPFTFATNGRPYLEQYKTKSGIWFLDLRQPDNVPKALHGWISPDGIMEMLEKDIQAGNQALQDLSYDLLRDKDGLNLRDYQVKAIQAAEKAVMEGKRTALLAMATSTGKTRTVLGMIYRFLTTNRFRRILFLVDRTALGEQAHDVFKERISVKRPDIFSLSIRKEQWLHAGLNWHDKLRLMHKEATYNDHTRNCFQALEPMQRPSG